jgi:hypothetical protein
MILHKELDGEKVVSWVIYVWTIGIILMLFGIFGTVMGMSFSKVSALEIRISEHNETQQVDMVQIKTQLSQIQADLAWLKNNLQ